MCIGYCITLFGNLSHKWLTGLRVYAMFKSFTITTCMNKIKIRCMCNAAMSSLAQSIVSYIYIFNAKRFFTNRKPLNINAKYPDEFDAHISQSVDKSGFVSTRSRYLFHSLPQQDLCHLERRRKSLTLYSSFGWRKKKSVWNIWYPIM